MRHQLAAGGEDLLVGAGPLQHLERGEARDRGHRIARERADLEDEILVGHREPVEMRHDVGAAGDGGERKAAAHDLAQGAEIGRDAVIFLGAAIGEAEAGHDLVEDQRNAVLGRHLAQRLQEARLGRDQALERLDDDAGQLVLLLLDQALDHLDVVEGRDQHLVRDGLRECRPSRGSRAGNCRGSWAPATPAHSRSCRDSRPRTSGSCRACGRRAPPAWHRDRPRCRSRRSAPGRRRAPPRRSPSASAMPWRLLPKKVVPSGTCACTAAVTSGWAWPMNIGPEPSRKSTYSLPASSQIRPPLPSFRITSAGMLPKLPPGSTRLACSTRSFDRIDGRSGCSW